MVGARKGTGAVVLVALAACGPDEGEFVSDYTRAYCAYYLECSDPALAVFDGLDTMDECTAAFAPDVAQQAGSCQLFARSARECLTALEGLACPSSSLDPDDGLPAVCSDVWVDCAVEEEG
jgi:hypothetical protein